MSRPTTLAAWLAYLETLHPKSIAMGLERVAAVHARMAAALACPVVTVTGTNGKGSTCAMLESMLRCAGHRTGLYTSPHLAAYNERVRIAGRAAGRRCARRRVQRRRGRARRGPADVFRVRHARRAVALRSRGLDVAILEVGLGGRLDAVNIVDADVAVVTSVDLDHMDYLGPDPRGDRLREGRHLPAGAAGRLRGTRPARDAHGARARASARRLR